LVRDLFAEWFQHFIERIPYHRPVFVFMDSHGSHITPEILSKVSDNGVHLATFPSHTTHLLQPLDAGMYRPLKKGWKREVEKLLTEYSGATPDCCDFNRLLVSAYRGAFQSTTALQKRGCSLSIEILFQLKQLLHLLSLKARLQMTMRLE
jgi:hypothetical protein